MVFKQLTFFNCTCHVSAHDFSYYFYFLNFFLISLILIKLSMFQVTIVQRVNVSATCQFVVVLFIFVQFSPDIRYFCLIYSLYSLFLFNLVPIFVKMK